MSQGKIFIVQKIKKIALTLLVICVVGLFLYIIIPHKDKVTYMTEDEKRLMCMSYGNDERIMAGYLTKVQEEGLMELRMAVDYLEEKYPGYEYDFFYFSGKSIYSDTCELKFLVDGTEDYFTVQVSLMDDGYVIQDNFFEHALGPKYNEMITEMLSEAGLENFVVHTRMGGYVEDEVYSRMPIDEFIKEMENHNVNVYLFVDMTGDDEIENNRVKNLIEGCLRSVNNRGGHKIFFVPMITKHCSTWEEGFEYCREHDGIILEFDTKNEGD